MRKQFTPVKINVFFTVDQNEGNLTCSGQGTDVNLLLNAIV